MRDAWRGVCLCGWALGLGVWAIPAQAATPVVPLQKKVQQTHQHLATQTPTHAKRAKKDMPSDKVAKDTAKAKLTSAQRLAKRQTKHKEWLALLRGEMSRYMKIFKGFAIPKVYYMRYRIRLYGRVLLLASDGVILTDSDKRNEPFCHLHVDLRVGNHSFDQTGKDGYDWSIYRSLLPGLRACPKEVNKDYLRKMLWRQTERDYRVAVGRYWRKKYVRSVKPKIWDKAGDFAKEPPTVYHAPLKPTLTFDKKRWKGVLARVSKSLRRAPRVIRSSFRLQMSDEVILGVASDGSEVRQRTYGYDWSMNVTYLDKNKEMRSASRSGYARKESELPSEADFQAKVREIANELRTVSEAEEGEPDVGPAIVDPMLAGAIFYDILMVRLETGRFLRKRDNRVFAKKIGKRVLPSFLSVVDDPTLSYWKGTPLSSHYLYDSEWVRARRMVMVENGILRNFYYSRKPYKNTKRSNGHGRASFTAVPFSRPGISIIQSKKAFDKQTLMKKLRQEILRQGRRYGYLLRRFQGYSNVRNMIYSVTPVEILRLDVKTGETKRLRNLRVRTSALQVLNGILATGNDYTVFNGSDSESSGTINITTIAPSLLIRRLDFTRLNRAEKKGYTLPAPFKAISLKKALKPKNKVKQACPKACPEVCRRCAVCQPAKGKK